MNPLLLQFIEETRDILEVMGQSFLALEKSPEDSEVIDALFRAVHTLKGNSGLFELTTLTKVVHSAEDVLDKVRDQVLSIDTGLIDDLLACMDFIQRLMEEVEASGNIPDSYSDEAQSIIEELRARLPLEDGVSFDDGLSGEQVEAPETLEWLVSVGEQQLEALFDANNAMFGIRYVPESQCFFKGEDPINMLQSMPGRVAMVLRPAKAWAALDMLDIYECNLEINAISTASLDELRDHFRYTMDQVAVYELARHELALPFGDWDEAGAIVTPLVEQLCEKGSAEDVEGLRNVVSLGLDMLSGDLASASLLRWLNRFIAADIPLQHFGPLVRAIADQALPDWDVDGAFAPLAAADVPHNDTLGTAETATLDPVTLDMLVDTLLSQQALLEMQGKGLKASSTLNVVSQVVANALIAIGDQEKATNLRELLQAVDEASRADELSAFLNDMIALYTQMQSDLVQQVPDVAVQARLEKDVSDIASDAARSTSEAGERANRVLKVPQEKVDRLMDLIGEMVVAKNALPYLAARAEEFYGSSEMAREIKLQFSVINRIAEDMQDGIMQVRMLPMGSIFQRFPRLVRDVAKQLGKQVRLILEGEDAEADKHIVESLGDPLIHILRNSLDHGIEDPQTRQAKGKDPVGRITVRASQEGDRVVIEVEDDGKGIDPLIIKRKAFEKGLIDEARLDAISDQEAVQLVFAPGFSTADVISNLSGRGVGMDVVKNSLEKIGGQVWLVSEKDRGTKITLTLPLSVAVSNVLMVHAGGQRYGVPMDVVRETVRLPADQIHLIKDRRIAVLRGEIVPLFGADQLLHLDEPPLSNDDGELAVLVVRVNGSTAGLIVDGFAHTTDVILKPFEGPLQGLSGFAGSALLGDGSVLLVLDLKELL